MRVLKYILRPLKAALSFFATQNDSNLGPGLTEHGRAVLFPDHGVRPELDSLGDCFDPFSLLINLRPSGDERRLLMEGNFQDAARHLKSRVRRRPDRHVSELLAVTSILHELRHLHDYFGTTCGFALLQQVLRDAIAFNKMWDALRKIGPVRLPLARWAQCQNAPQVLKDYLATRRAYIDCLHVVYGSYKSRQIPYQPNVVEIMQEFALKGMGLHIPAVMVDLKDATSGARIQRCMPLGCRVLMEGTAFVTQRHAVAGLFGNQDSDRIKQAVMAVPMDELRQLDYMAVDYFLTKRLGQFYTRYQLALSDVAMMAEEPTDLSTSHAGIRFSKAVAAAKGLGLNHQDSDSDLQKYMDKICDRLGWKPVSEVATQALSQSNSFLNDSMKSAEADTLWHQIMRAAFRLHGLFMAPREKAPEVLAHLPLYFGMLKVWAPTIPILREGNSTECGGITAEDGKGFLSWFLFEHLQRQLLFSTNLPCPLPRGTHKCPGDPLRKKHHNASHTCPLFRLAEQMGVIDAVGKGAK